MRERALAVLEGVQAVMSLEGATDRPAFEAFIEQVLLSTLVLGQIVIMDNLSTHESHKAQRMAKEAGCFWLFLPYSPAISMWDSEKPKND